MLDGIALWKKLSLQSQKIYSSNDLYFFVAIQFLKSYACYISSIETQMGMVHNLPFTMFLYSVA